MIKEYFLTMTMFYFEKTLSSNDKSKIKKVWNKLKRNITLLEFSAKINRYNFNSNIIVSYILKDKDLYDSKIYKKVINEIYSNKVLAQKKPLKSSINTFLLLTLENEELKLSKEQKVFLIFEAETSPYTKKYYEEGLKHEISIHGGGIFDIRYKILQNKNYTFQEKKNLFLLFYPDEEVRVDILKEMEWDILNMLVTNYEDSEYEEIYNLNNEPLINKLKVQNKKDELLEKINFCKL